jgi:hypothetical protein
LPDIHFREAVQGIVQCDNVQLFLLRQRDRLVESKCQAVGATLGGAASASMVDQDLAHEAGGYAKKMSAAHHLQRGLSHQPEICLVYQRGALERVVRTFRFQVVSREPAKFVIHHGKQAVEGGLVPTPPPD